MPPAFLALILAPLLAVLCRPLPRPHSPVIPEETLPLTRAGAKTQWQPAQRHPRGEPAPDASRGGDPAATTTSGATCRPDLPAPPALEPPALPCIPNSASRPPAARPLPELSFPTHQKNPPKLSLASPPPSGGRAGQRQLPPSPPPIPMPTPPPLPHPRPSGRGNEGAPVDGLGARWVSGGCLRCACGGGWLGGLGGRVLRGRRGGRGGRGGGRRGHPDSGCCAGGCTASCHR